MYWEYFDAKNEAEGVKQNKNKKRNFSESAAASQTSGAHANKINFGTPISPLDHTNRTVMNVSVLCSKTRFPFMSQLMR